MRVRQKQDAGAAAVPIGHSYSHLSSASYCDSSCCVLLALVFSPTSHYTQVAGAESIAFDAACRLAPADCGALSR
jgi:hypothetical protein